MMKTQSSSTTLLNDKTKNPQRNAFHRHNKGHSLSSPAGIGAIFALIIAAALFTSLSVSASRSVSQLSLSAKAGTGTINDQVKSSASRFNSVKGISSPFRLVQQATPTPTPVPEEAIATFAVVNDACTNVPKSSFVLDEKVCARASNAPLRSPSALRRFNWGDPKGFVRQSEDVVADPDTNIFTLPHDNTSSIDGVTIDNRGTWGVSLNSTDNSTRAIAYFTVSDPTNLSADLVVYNFSTSADPIEPGTP